MSRTLEVVTPENVAIRYELAGFGSRAAAAATDMAILHLLIQPLLAGFFALLVWLKLLPSWDKMERWYEMQQSIIIALLVLIFALTTWGYYLFFETVWNGETPGKRWMGLRVIKDDGHPVDFRAVVIRNLLRLIDSMPLTYSVAFAVMMASPQYRRLGDMAGGTVVIRHGKEGARKQGGFGEAVEFRLLDGPALSALARLTREDVRIAQRFLARRSALPFALRAEFARRLAQPLIEKIAYQVPALGMDYERWLEELDLAHRARVYVGIATAPAAPVSPVRQEPASSPVAEADPEIRKW